jgi:hypothetical protein
MRTNSKGASSNLADQLNTLQKYDKYITDKVDAQKQKIADLQAQLAKTEAN